MVFSRFPLSLKMQLGNTPEFYQNKDEEAKDILNYKKLLSNFGAEELEDELLNDQGKASFIYL